MDFFNQHLNQDFSGMDMDEFNAGDLPMNEDELSALLQPIEQYGTPFGQSTPGAETSPRNDGQGDDGQGVDGQGDAGQHQGNDGHHHHEGDPAQAGQDENMPDVDPYLSFGYSPYPTPQASQQEPNSDAAMMPSPAKWEEKHECGGATAQYTIAATPASTVDDDEQAPQGAGDGQHVGTPVQQYTIAATPASTQGGDEDTSQDEVQKTPRPVSPWFAGEDQHVATPVQQYTIATTPASTQADDEDTAQDTAQDDVQKTPQPAAPKSGPSLDTIVEAPASPPAEHDGPVAKDQEMKDNVDYPTPQPVDLMMTPLPSHDMGTPGGPQYTVAQTPASSDDDASTIRAASPPAETHALQDAHVHEAPIDRDEEMQKDEQTASQEEHHQAADNVPTHQGGAATPPAEEDTHDDAASESTGLFVTDHPSLVEQVPSPPASESSGLFVPDHPPAVEQEAHTPVSELAGRFAGNGQHPAEAFASTPGAPASEMTGLFVNDEQPPAEPPVPEQPAARPPAQDVPEQPVAHPPAQAAPVSSAHPLVVSWLNSTGPVHLEALQAHQEAHHEVRQVDVMSVVSSELDAPVRWDINTPPSEVPREMPTRADFCSLRPGRLNPAHYRWGPPTAQPIFIEPTPSQMPARFQRPCVPDPFDRSPYRYGAKRPRESDSEGDRQAKARRLAALAAKRARKAPNLGKLPFEVRERILRLLLVSTSGPIYLSDGWTRLCRHSRQTPHPELSTRILESCKTIYREGVRILYGRNTFLLRLRDPPIHSALDGDENDSDAEMDDDAEGDDDGDYQDDAVTEVAPGQQGRTNSDVPEERNVIHITKYAPLFKHIIIEAEFVRNDRENLDAMAAAIRTFIPPRGRLPKTAYRPERDPVPIDEVYTHRLKKDGPVKKTLLQLSLPEILTLDIHITPHPLDEPLVPDLPEQQQDDDQQSDAGDQQQQEGEEQLQNGEEDGLAQQMQQMLQLQQATAPVRCTFLGFFDWKTCRVMKAVGNLLPQCLSVQVTPRALGSGIEVPTLPRTEIDMRAQRLMLRRDAEKRSLMIDFGEAHNDFWQGDLTMAQERWTRSKANQEALRQLASDVQACCWRYADVVEAEALQAMDDME